MNIVTIYKIIIQSEYNHVNILIIKCLKTFIEYNFYPPEIGLNG